MSFCLGFLCFFPVMSHVSLLPLVLEVYDPVCLDGPACFFLLLVYPWFFFSYPLTNIPFSLLHTQVDKSGRFFQLREGNLLFSTTIHTYYTGEGRAFVWFERKLYDFMVFFFFFFFLLLRFIPYFSS
ncbi:hypothetical protein QBC36DRAFT_61515 [Triangularia setosa]|uniref:Uncharacterized protein n=1 Tax=Triangularia setosa TaxID=2587417 RepID=A0AAN7A3Y8_9PEZI|nr:hypothetical protein QBC36DRAFT_61515 [Podospora setosa]